MTDSPKYIFCDIDMTLWDHEWIIPDSAEKAIRAALAKGNRVFINSGRSRSNIHRHGIENLPWSGIVCACGCHIEVDGKILYEKTIPYEETKKAVDLFTAHRMPVILEGRDLHFFNVKDFGGDPYVENLWNELAEYARPMDALTPADPINKFSANISSEKDLSACYEALKDTLDFINHGSVVEAVPKGHSKATGIQWLMDRFNIPKDNIDAIGDSVNDSEMISFAAHAIAMGNAVPEIKAMAEYVTSDIHEDGLYRAFEHYELM